MREAETPVPVRASVLLVDNDDLIQESVGCMLTCLGYTPIIVSTGEEALSRLVAGLRPASIILDMDVPGLGGAGTLPLIRALKPTLPVLITTARSDEGLMHLMRSHQKVTFIFKPFTLSELETHLC